MQRNKGFTLVELIIVIILLGVIGTFTFSYLGFGARIFTDTVGREQIVSQSRFAIQRLNMELRESLPRSVYLRNHTNPTNNTTHECIEFIPIFSSGQYLELPLDESLSSSFVAVAPPGSISETDLIEKYLFVYAINEDVIYDANVSNRRKTIVDADFDNPNDGLMTLLFDSSELSSFSSQSVGRRYYTATGPVMWCYTHTHPHETGELVRYWDYALSVDPNVKPPLQTTGAQFEVMANNIANTAVSVPPFRVTEATLTRNNIVHIDLRLRRGETQEPLQLTREVFIPNVP